MAKEKILLTGSTGYLGKYIAKELIKQNYKARLIVRNKAKADFDEQKYDVREAQVTQPETLKGVCENIDVVISTVGITRQKDGLTYMDVDYQANINLLNEAKKSGVKRFIYVSAIHVDKLRKLKIADAKEKFVDELNASGINYCILRPTGFFSDMADFLEMAKKGKVYLFGSGELTLNPIHGADLAEFCVNQINSKENELEVGGPVVYTHNQLAELALKAHNKPIKIVHLPDFIRKMTIGLARTFMNSKKYGPIEFFLTAMAMDGSAPTYGTHKLDEFFEEQVNKKK